MGFAFCVSGFGICVYSFEETRHAFKKCVLAIEKNCNRALRYTHTHIYIIPIPSTHTHTHTHTHIQACKHPWFLINSHIPKPKINALKPRHKPTLLALTL